MTWFILWVLAVTWSLTVNQPTNQQLFYDKVQQYVTVSYNKVINVDGLYGAQCRDLAVDYMNQIHDGQRLLGWSPLWLRYKWLAWWDRKTPGLQTPPPKKWDLIILKLNPKYNHIGVVVEATDTYVMVLEQNWWTGRATARGDDRVTTFKRYYSQVRWWFTPQLPEEKPEFFRIDGKPIPFDF